MTPDPLAWDLPYFATMDQGSSCYVKPAGPVRLSCKLDLTIAKSIYDTRALALELIQNGGVTTNLTFYNIYT